MSEDKDAKLEEIREAEEAQEAGLDEPSGPRQIDLSKIPVVERRELRGVVVGVLPGAEGAKQLHILNPVTATELVVPMDEAHAREVGQALCQGGIQPATPQEAAELAAAADQAG